MQQTGGIKAKDKTSNARVKKNNNKSIEANQTVYEYYKRLKKKLFFNFQKYISNLYKWTDGVYNNLVLECLMFNKSCHIVSLFKDYMIYDYIQEFLKRYYSTDEIKERLAKISNYYKNYSTFFCKPTFRFHILNNLIQTYSNNKAQCFYKLNYKKENKDSLNDKLAKTIFNSTLKSNIEKYQMSTLNHSRASIDLDGEMSFMKSDLFTNRSRKENSIIKIVNTMDRKCETECSAMLLTTSTKYIPTEVSRTSKLSKLYAKVTQNLNKKLEYINMSKEKVRSELIKKSSFLKLAEDNKLRINFDKKSRITTGLSYILRGKSKNERLRVSTDAGNDDNVKMSFTLKVDKIAKNENKSNDIKSPIQINNLNININNHFDIVDAFNQKTIRANKHTSQCSSMLQKYISPRKVSNINIYKTSSIKNSTNVSNRHSVNFNSYLQTRKQITSISPGISKYNITSSTVNDVTSSKDQSTIKSKSPLIKPDSVKSSYLRNSLTKKTLVKK
jgi:hypothetical protein